ncbi:MAG: NUDIX domain-containing protein, partial [Melioribacteraceae bacterium]
MNVKSSLIEAHIFRRNGVDIEFLLLKRSPGEKYPGLWQMVTGSVENGEKRYETALREIKEETGIVPIKFWIVSNV